MADTTRNIFSLSEYSDDTIAGEGIPLDSVYVRDNAADNAYIGGGAGGPSGNQISIMDKLTFSTGGLARVPSADLTNFGGTNAAPFSSSFAGYFAAGVTGNSPGAAAQDRRSYVRKLTYSTETIANIDNILGSPSSMGQGPQGMGGANSATNGYAGAGSGTGGGDERSWVFKLAFAADSWSQLPSLPSSVQYQGDAIGNLDAGYWSGGSPGVRTMVQKVSYATDSTSRNPGSDLVSPGRYFAGAGNADTGFLMGRGASPTAYSTILKFTYATETSSLHPSTMPYPVKQARGTGSLSDGYAAGGEDGPGSPVYSTVSKLDYSTGTASNLGTNMTRGEGINVLAVSARDHGATGKRSLKRWTDGGEITPNNGYSIAGGSPMVTSTDRVNMSTDSVERVPGMNAYQNSWLAGNTMASSPNKGYFGGTFPGMSSSIWNIVYATDGREHNPSLNLYSTYQYFVSAGNVNKGYVLGGDIGNNTVSSVSRMTYSTDSTSRIPGANLPGTPTPSFATGEGTSAFSSSGDESGAAYLTAGKEWPSQGNRSYIWKMSYTTETSSLLPARVTEGRWYATGHSEKSAGYLVGGWIGPSGVTNVLKFPWSTETFVTDGGDGMMRSGAATGNQQAAYVMGGIDNIINSSNVSNIKKFTYSTSTSSQITATLTGTPSTAPKQGAFGTGALTNNLPSVPDAPTATPTPGISPLADSAPNFGVAGGGDVIPGGAYTLFDKLEYSTETNSTLPSSDATVGTSGYTQRSITSLTEGWSNSANGTHLWKFVYSTSTQNPSPASHTNRNHADGLTFSNKTEGYFGAGANVGSPGPSYSGGPANSLDKFTFSTSTISQVPDLSASPSNAYYDFNTSNIGNQNAGYYSGGNSRSVGKYVYATSTSTMTNNFIAENSTNPMGVGNATNGYIVAGDRSSTDRIAYSTDTHTKLPGASYPPGDQTWGGGSHSSSDAGYIQGGRSPSAPNSPFNYHWSNTRKLTYSTETLTELPASADISVGRNDYSGMSARQNNNGSAVPAPNVI